MIVLHDPNTLLHETVELLGAKVRPALESPARIQTLVEAIEKSHHDLHIQKTPADEALQRLLDLVILTHKPDYVDHLRTAHQDWLSAQLIGPSDSILPECFVFSSAARKSPQRPKDIFARAGYYAFDMSSGITDKTYKSAIASANLALDAADITARDRGSPATVLALCRPPGHHCDGRRAGGYCYINNAALAVTTWRDKVPNAKVGILDIDFHHGNGTQDIFYDDPITFYTSIHGEDEFPYYAGSEDERGGDNAMGTILNLPLKTGSSFSQYLEKLEIALSALEAFGGDFLLISLGFDTFYLDPLGCFRIDTDDYSTIAHTIRKRFAKIPAVILFEGGYVIEHLGSNMLSFLRGWEEAAASDL